MWCDNNLLSIHVCLDTDGSIKSHTDCDQRLSPNLHRHPQLSLLLHEHKSSWQLKLLFSSLSHLFWLLVQTNGPLAYVNVITSMTVALLSGAALVSPASQPEITESVSACLCWTVSASSHLSLWQ